MCFNVENKRPAFSSNFLNQDMIWSATFVGRGADYVMKTLKAVAHDSSTTTPRNCCIFPCRWATTTKKWGRDHDLGTVSESPNAST